MRPEERFLTNILDKNHSQRWIYLCQQFFYLALTLLGYNSLKLINTSFFHEEFDHWLLEIFLTNQRL